MYYRLNKFSKNIHNEIYNLRIVLLDEGMTKIYFSKTLQFRAISQKIRDHKRFIAASYPFLNNNNTRDLT